MFSKRLYEFVVLATVSAAILSGCQSTKPDTGEGPAEPPPATEKPAPQVTGPAFEKSSYSALPPSAVSDWENARNAFRRSCEVKAFSQNSVWKGVCQKASDGTVSAVVFFQENFTPWNVISAEFSDGEQTGSSDTGLMTGYYEPILSASSARSASASWPVLSTPPDLIDVELSSLYPELKNKRLRGKLSGRKLIPYDSRETIDKRTDLYPYAIAWLADPIDQLFLQIQGSGKLLIDKKTLIRVSYDDQNGHPYKPVAKWLINKKEMPASSASMQSIRAWAKANPKRVPELLAFNPSYVFFKQMTGDDLSSGPRGAQGVPLTAGASVAVDRSFWKLGVPFFVSAFQDKPSLQFSRPVIAQDTGGAIRGVIRFDYFWGSGHEAGEQAGRQKSTVRAWVLVPKGQTPEKLLAR